MKREARDRMERQPKPVESISLSQRHPRLRLTLILLALALLAGAILFAWREASRVENGWHTVEAEGGHGPTLAEHFTLSYAYGTTPPYGTAERRLVTSVYTQACLEAYARYSLLPSEAVPGNMAWLNAHPNETVTLDPRLYEDLSLLAPTRYLFLAPLYEMQRSVLFSSSDTEASAADTRMDADALQFLRDILPVIQDPDALSLELLGDGRACLHVSPECLSLYASYGISSLCDFGPLTDAFALDAVADALEERHLTEAILSSDSGCTRALGGTAQGILYTLLDSPAQAAAVTVPGPVSLVRLRAFPVTGDPEGRYYRYAGGEIRQSFLSPLTGLDSAAIPSLLYAARDKGCAAALLDILPAFLGDTALPSLSGTESLVTLDGKAIHSSGQPLQLAPLLE